MNLTGEMGMTTETSNAREWCPACAGAGWTPDLDTADPVRCPDCAGSGRAEHAITVNEAAAPPPAAACPNCDDTGDVTRADGEWRGVCTCPAGQPPAAARGDVRG